MHVESESMLELFEPIAEQARIAVPTNSVPIAIIGAGTIVDVAHLPAYQSLGVDVRGIYDLDVSRAIGVAARHGIPHVCDSVGSVLNDELVGVVDIAVVPTAQPELVRADIAAGKHLLCQKPFALDLAEGRALAAEGETGGHQDRGPTAIAIR